MNASQTFRVCLALGLCLAFAYPFGSISYASSASGQLSFEYSNIFNALHSYRDAYRRFPRDGPNLPGRLEMSWRVHLLAFYESPLPSDLLKAAGWDEVLRLEGALKLRSPFRHPFFDQPEKAPILSRVLGPGTFFGDGKTPFRFNPVTDHSKRLWLVEAERRDGDHWMKPGDWNYDPENPHAGLAHYWHGRTSGAPGCVVIFGDGSRRFLSPNVPDAALRDVIAPPHDRPILWDASFFEAAREPTLARWFWPFILYSAVTGCAAIVILARMLFRCDVQPGEIPLLAVGVYQLTCLTSFCTIYRFEYFPLLHYSADHIPYWGWPTVAANLAMLLGAGYFRSQKKWSLFFLGVHIVTFLLIVPALLPRWSGFAPEEAMVYHATPLYFASLGVLAVTISIIERPVRRWRHWLCLAAFFLPITWQTIGKAYTGLHHDRSINYRIGE